MTIAAPPIPLKGDGELSWTKVAGTAHAPLTTLALRNRESKTMDVSRDDLYRLIVEEYAAAEGLQLEALSQDKYEEFLAWIQKKGPNCHT